MGEPQTSSPAGPDTAGEALGEDLDRLIETLERVEGKLDRLLAVTAEAVDHAPIRLRVLLRSVLHA